MPINLFFTARWKAVVPVRFRILGLASFSIKSLANSKNLQSIAICKGVLPL